MRSNPKTKSKRKRSRKTKPKFERYEIGRSPLAQNPNQSDVCKLLRVSKGELRWLIANKERFTIREDKQVKEKLRRLVYPVGQLRRVHVTIASLLNRIKLPDYLYSPRKKRGQRDNASLHLGQSEYLSLDIKKFYPSTTERQVWHWFRFGLGIKGDVAGLLTKLLTVDGTVYFGSPVTPVLCALVHRKMFDAIDERCRRDGLNNSLWVDDLTVSGTKITGSLMTDIKRCVRASGLRAHKVKLRSKRRPVFVTGIGIDGVSLVAPHSMHLRIRDCWKGVHSARDLESACNASQRLLSALGGLRHVVCGRSPQGRRAADTMNAVRQKLRKRHRLAALERSRRKQSEAVSDESAPF